MEWMKLFDKAIDYIEKHITEDIGVEDIAKEIPMKTDNWLDEIIYNPPELNFVYTLREYQPYEEEFKESSSVSINSSSSNYFNKQEKKKTKTIKDLTFFQTRVYNTNYESN